MVLGSNSWFLFHITITETFKVAELDTSHFQKNINSPKIVTIKCFRGKTTKTRLCIPSPRLEYDQNIYLFVEYSLNLWTLEFLAKQEAYIGMVLRGLLLSTKKRNYHQGNLVLYILIHQLIIHHSLTGSRCCRFEFDDILLGHMMLSILPRRSRYSSLTKRRIRVIQFKFSRSRRKGASNNDTKFNEVSKYCNK